MHTATGFFRYEQLSRSPCVMHRSVLLWKYDVPKAKSAERQFPDLSIQANLIHFNADKEKRKKNPVISVYSFYLVLLSISDIKSL